MEQQVLDSVCDRDSGEHARKTFDKHSIFSFIR